MTISFLRWRPRRLRKDKTKNNNKLSRKSSSSSNRPRDIPATEHHQTSHNRTISTKYWNADSIGSPTLDRLPSISTDNKSITGTWDISPSTEQSPKLVRTLSRHISMQFRELSPASTTQQETDPGDDDKEKPQQQQKDPMSVITSLDWMDFEPRQ